MEFTEELVFRIIHEFPQCIECGDDHLSMREMYFHRGDCRRGASLSADELYRRMCERASALRPVEVARCRCGQIATGTGWVKYHTHHNIVEFFPLCDEHSFWEDETGRQVGFLPGFFSKNTQVVERRVFDTGSNTA